MNRILKILAHVRRALGRMRMPPRVVFVTVNREFLERGLAAQAASADLGRHPGMPWVLLQLRGRADYFAQRALESGSAELAAFANGIRVAARTVVESTASPEQAPDERVEAPWFERIAEAQRMSHGTRTAAEMSKQFAKFRANITEVQ